MGRKTKFIDKDNSQKFHLLHRSQTDAAYANEQVPSDFVLVAADESANSNNRGRSARRNDTLSEKLSANKDHINEMGFVNDGYDYSQHLKEMGGGKFFGKNGKPMDLDFSYNKEVAFELPEDALPSGAEMERDLQAITISHELMDADIHAALFDGADEEGEFEELQDDFITEAMMEPMTSDFDYDAHIAALIKRSEEKLGVVSARGWESASDKKLRSRKVVRYGDGVEEADSDEEYEEFSDFEENEEEEGEEDRVFRDVVSAEERRKIELQFERTLEEYDDDEIGDLEDDEEQLEGGEIELTSDDPLFTSMIEEFLQEQADLKYAEGRLVLPKGTRSTFLVRDGQDAQTVVDENGQAIAETPIDTHKLAAEQELLQVESAQFLQDLDELGETHPELETCQQYLQEEREVERWDCETILSTYSTLDNHPSLIRDTNSKFRKFKSRHERRLDAEAKASSDTVSMGTREAVPRNVTSARQPVRIVLSGKLNLPEGFGPGDKGDSKKAVAGRQLKAARAATASRSKVSAMSHIPEATTEDEESEEDGEQDSANSQRSESSFEERRKKKPAAPGSRPQGETAEEKRLRKQRVKEERRTKRQSKKELRTAFESESHRIMQVSGREQSTDHVSVFKYSM